MSQELVPAFYLTSVSHGHRVSKGEGTQQVILPH